MVLSGAMVRSVLLIGSRIALVGALAAVTWSSLAPPDDLPSEIALSDKLLHGIAYAVLGVVAALAQRRPRVILTELLLTAFGLLMEVLQDRTTYRTFDLADLYADALGAAIGVVVVAWPMRLAERRRARSDGA
jgi:VanZ family protein